jgi:hypothetical protein
MSNKGKKKGGSAPEPQQVNVSPADKLKVLLSIFH